jgi:transposase
MTAAAPLGVVTFLFTDIEGPTRRWESDADAMRAALLAHDEVLRTAIEKHEGFLFSHTGDGVVAAFNSPRSAVDAAVAAQGALQLAVRMGIATGEAELRDGDYFGTVLNRAARVMAAGHGGQILLADSTAVLLSGVDLVDLGPRRLRDVPTPVGVFQVLASLGAHGLVRGSFVSPEPIRQLRDLTRTRAAVTREGTREIQRLEKLLEDAGIKLSSVAADLNGASSRAMLEALLAGETDPAAMPDLAQKRLRVKIPQLTEALYGRFTPHHAFLTRMHLDLIDQHTAAIEQLTDRIEVVIEPFRRFRDLICTIPGIGGHTADIVVAETGADMTRFPTAQHLASWAGTVPGNNESAGKVKSRRTRPGNPYLQGAPGTAAMSISHTHDTYLAAKYRRIASRRGPLKANVAVQRALLVAIWNIATTNSSYRDPGGDYFTRLNPHRARNNAVRQLEAMGYHVTLDKAS